MTLDEGTRLRLRALFEESDWPKAEALLVSWELPSVGNPGERLHRAALKVSHGSVPKLVEAIALGSWDFRDLLLAAGFENDLAAHESWMPRS